MNDERLPEYVTKAQAAALVTERFFPIGPRSVERWPINAYRPGRAVVFRTAELLEAARAMAESRLIRAV